MAVAAEAYFRHAVLKAEVHTVRRLQTLASFHFSGVVEDGLVVGAGFGYHFSGLEERMLGLQTHV